MSAKTTKLVGCFCPRCVRNGKAGLPHEYKAKPQPKPRLKLVAKAKRDA